MSATEEPSLWTDDSESDVETATPLIAGCADVNEIIDDSCPLLEAVRLQNVKIVRLLVEDGADVEATNRRGDTGWKKMMKPKAVDILQYLINVGARVNRSNMLGDTAIHEPDIQQYSVELLINNGAVNRPNKYEFSPIVVAAFWDKMQVVQFLAEYTSKRDTPSFQRRLNETRNTYSFAKDIAGIMDAFRLLGVNSINDNLKNTRRAWSNALSICEKAGLPLKFHVKRAPLCVCRAVANAEETVDCAELSESVDAWSAVSLAAQEMVTGTELLKRSMKRKHPTWVSHFHPCFTFPISSCSVIYHSGIKIRRYSLLDTTYVLKLQKLQTDLQEHFHSKAFLSNTEGLSKMSDHYPSTFTMPIKDGVLLTMISLADVILGIEPVCFFKARRHQNNVDTMAYYLQRHWLWLYPHDLPRTRHRCTYRACITCGQFVIRFGDVSHPYSSCFTPSMSNSTTDLICKRCSLSHPGIGNKRSAPFKQSLPSAGYYSYRNSNSLTLAGKLAGKVNKTTSKTKICPHCGLVSEQHPLLQRLRQSSEDVFGHYREFVNKEELTEIMDNPTALDLQKLLIELRLIWQYTMIDIDQIVTKAMLIQDITSFVKFCRYAFQFVKIFFARNVDTYRYTFRRLTSLLLNVLQENNGVCIDLVFFTDGLEFAVDGIEAALEMPIYKDDPDRLDYWLNDCIEFISLVLSAYCFELSCCKWPPQGRCLVDVLAKEYCQGRNCTNEHFPSPNRQDNVPQTENTSISNGDTIRKEGNDFPDHRDRFINQVYRLLCLNLRPCTGKSLIENACGLILLHSCEISPYIFTVKLFLQIGGDPNYVNIDGNTLVGYVLKTTGQEEENVHCLLKALMAAGAHLDAYKRSYVGDVQVEKLHHFLKQNRICPVRNGMLACLVAIAMRRNGLTSRIASAKSPIPNMLLTFLDLH